MDKETGGTAVADAAATTTTADATTTATATVADTTTTTNTATTDKAATDYSSVILPKDATIDSAVLERTVAIARERGLSTEQAQATVDLINEQVGASRTALLAAHQPGGAEWTKQLDAWKADTLADETLGKTPEERKAAIDLGGSVLKQFKAVNPAMGEAMDTFLTTTGIGERKELAHFLAWLGKSAAERPVVLGSDSTIKSPDQKLQEMYPSMNK